MLETRNGHVGTAPLPRLTRLGDLLGDLELAAIEAREAYESGRPRNPVTGIPSLDRELGGCLSNGLHVLHGPTGSGKSALAQQIAGDCRFPAVLVTAEMQPVELLRRHTARKTDTPLSRLKDGSLPPSEVMELARRAVEESPYLALVDATYAFADANWIRNALESTRRDSPRALLVIDSLHSWAMRMPGVEDTSEYDRLDRALDVLVRLAAEVSCPILIVAERNRASRVSGGVAAGAGTRHIEFWSESVLGLSYEKDADTPPAPGPAGEVPMVLSIDKNRSGGSGKRIKLTFNGSRMRFGELGKPA
jgi:replicative DNA helicase